MLYDLAKTKFNVSRRHCQRDNHDKTCRTPTTTLQFIKANLQIANLPTQQCAVVVHGCARGEITMRYSLMQ
jgi:hypothetical protein